MDHGPLLNDLHGKIFFILSAASVSSVVKNSSFVPFVLFVVKCLPKLWRRGKPKRKAADEK